MRYLFLISYFLFCSLTEAQENSTVDSLNTVIDSNQSNDSKVSSYIALADIYANSDRAESEEKLKKALILVEKGTKKELLGKVYYHLGTINYKNEKDDIAMSYFLKVDSLFTAHNIVNEDLVRTKFFQSQILKFTFTEEGLLKSKDHLDKMLVYASQIQDSALVHWGYQKLGGYYAVLSEMKDKKHNLETALKYYNKSKNYFQKKEQYQNLITTLWSISSIYERLGNLKEAKIYQELRIKTLDKIKDSEEKGIVFKSAGDFYTSIGNPKKGLELLKKATQYFNNFGFPNARDKNELYKYKSNAYYQLGLLDKAYHYKNLELNSLDSINKISNRQKALELETKYQTQKKEQEIALLMSQNELAEQQKKNQRNLLLGGLGLTTATGIFLFLGYRNRKKTNDKLRELDQLKSNFFANISHEFRTPLSLISGPLEQQLQKEGLTSQELQNLNIAKRNCTRLVTLVDQLLDLSKLESGHFALKVKEGSLGTFLKSLTSSFQFLAQENEQTYTTDIIIKERATWFDTDALEKIVTNLITNAIKYSPSAETILVQASIKKGALYFSVKNSGSPLSQDVLATLFDRFQRADETTTGSGIGLALTKELVTLHKGTITASSDQDWTTFDVVLPIQENAFTEAEKTDGLVSNNAFAKATSTTPQPQVPTAEEIDIFAKNNKPILLIVDDNEDLRTYVSSLFDQSHTILTAINGKDGLEKALEHVPDLIITDLMMPEDDGITLTRNCKTTEATSHIPVLMLTAKAGDENTLLGLETGADAYITKPFNTEILKTTVHNLQETRDKLQERFSQEVVLLPKDVATNATEEKFLTNLQEVMDKSLIESDFNTEAFAEAVGMSRMQLHRKLKALTGLSATEFIRGQRLKLAAQMLKKSDINVSQVGYAVGFNNHSYFTKCFKEKYGISPSDYSKKA